MHRSLRLMGWASRYIQKLRAGETVSFGPHGQSMTGRIESGQLCTVAPVDPEMLEVGDINDSVRTKKSTREAARPVTPNRAQ
jgi:hypothetical protein